MVFGKTARFVTIVVFAQFLAEAKASVNGGTDCAACTLIVGLVEQLAQVHKTDVITAAENNLCANLQAPLGEGCTNLLEIYGPALIDAVYYNETPDIVCHRIGFCTQEPGTPFCHLFPLPSNFETRNFFEDKTKAQTRSLCDLPEMSEICNIFNSFVDGHLPLQDKDRDRFGVEPTLRGSNWRGKDCDDSNKDFYPGRRPIDNDREMDSNCNGIYGVDPDSGIPFEDLYCGDSPRGVAILGDSAAAHFHIPPNYFMAETLNKDTFKDIRMVLTNELDWPMLSSVTAYMENGWSDIIKGPVDSIYMRVLARNQCNHRDFQNIGVNGARSSSMNDVVQGLARNKTTDYPLLVVLALIGNDVCNGKADTLGAMTTPEDYAENTMVTLNYLDANLPNGSVVIINGLADGRVLWTNMNDRIHPIGELNNDVKFKDLYDYMNCLQISPCTGWLTSNDTLRDLTSQRATALSQQAKMIANTKTFNNFQLIYQDYDIQALIDTWVSRGGEAHEVIDSFDGFHPSQVAQALGAEYMFNLLEKTNSDVIGKVNAYNQKITAQFGDQGGY